MTRLGLGGGAKVIENTLCQWCLVIARLGAHGKVNAPIIGVDRRDLKRCGTLFLDEAAEIPLALQGKLPRAIQERRFERVGGTRTLEVDIRLVAATNRPLEEMIESGDFREDIYYRLNVVPVPLPPLRERPGDILLLAEAFIKELNNRDDRQVRRLTPGAVQRLADHDWPGNIRELYNAIEYAFALSDGDLLEIGNLPESLRDSVRPANQGPPGTEKEQILYALEQTSFNQGRAAALLGMNRSTLYRKRKKYNAGAARRSQARNAQPPCHAVRRNRVSPSQSIGRHDLPSKSPGRVSMGA